MHIVGVYFIYCNAIHTEGVYHILDMVTWNTVLGIQRPKTDHSVTNWPDHGGVGPQTSPVLHKKFGKMNTKVLARSKIL